MQNIILIQLVKDISFIDKSCMYCDSNIPAGTTYYRERAMTSQSICKSCIQLIEYSKGNYVSWW